MSLHRDVQAALMDRTTLLSPTLVVPNLVAANCQLVYNQVRRAGVAQW